MVIAHLDMLRWFEMAQWFQIFQLFYCQISREREPLSNKGIHFSFLNCLRSIVILLTCRVNLTIAKMAVFVRTDHRDRLIRFEETEISFVKLSGTISNFHGGVDRRNAFSTPKVGTSKRGNIFWQEQNLLFT